ncbi:MAG: DUF333 domain-containing protein [archaeon]
MKKALLTFLTIALVLVAACTAPNNNGNKGDNSQLANPASVYCKENGGILEIVKATDGSESGICTLKDGIKCDEWAYFRGECGKLNNHVCSAAEKSAEICTMEYAPVCGDDGVTYGNGCGACASKNVNFYTFGECKEDCGECPMLSPPGPGFCNDGKIVSGGKNSCGCDLPPSCEKNTEGIKTFCTTRTQVCTKEYVPVCGWFNSDIKCFKYPCAASYGNKCEACANSNVDYWTEGDCPE